MSKTVNAILYEGYIAVLMPDERPIKHVVLESPSEKGTQGDLSWRYYMPESYTTTLANENAKMRELVADMWDFFCVVRDEYDDVQAHKRELEFTIDVWKRMHDLGIEVDE